MAQYQSLLTRWDSEKSASFFCDIFNISVFIVSIYSNQDLSETESPPLLNPLAYYFFITHGAPTNTNFLVKNGNLVHLYFIHTKLIFKRAFHQLSNGIRHVMPSTDRSLELKAKNSDGLDRLTAGCVCQWVKSHLLSSGIIRSSQFSPI